MITAPHPPSPRFFSGKFLDVNSFQLGSCYIDFAAMGTARATHRKRLHKLIVFTEKIIDKPQLIKIIPSVILDCFNGVFFKPDKIIWDRRRLVIDTLNDYGVPLAIGVVKSQAIYCSF